MTPVGRPRKPRLDDITVTKFVHGPDPAVMLREGLLQQLPLVLLVYEAADGALQPHHCR